jgi:hypothetical protein
VEDYDDKGSVEKKSLVESQGAWREDEFMAVTRLVVK